jgi:Kdo2-lipid IVA lauroyltransferase/acyltransferase
LLRLLPERLCRFLGTLFGWIGFMVLADRRRVAVNNVHRMFPDVSEVEARRIARSCFEKLGLNFIEVLLLPFVPKDQYAERFHLEGGEHMMEALKAGRGVLALGFHYSNWEINGLVSSLLGTEIVALARPLKAYPALNRFLNGLRSATGLTIIPNRDTARDVVRLARENRIVALLGDQREKRSKAVWVDFFGQKVPTSKGIVAIAMKTGAAIIPVHSRRDGFLRHTFFCSEPLPIERKGAPVGELIARNARRVNQFLEELIVAQPDAWFLVHRRFERRQS